MQVQTGKTAVIYARYSSDSQRDASIEDQVRNCRRHAEREGIDVKHVYSDRAVTGAVRSRGDYLRMLDAAYAGEFATLMVDDLSRLSRDDYEMKGVLRRLAWHGVRVIGVTDGYDSMRKGHKIHAGFKGLMNEMHLDDIREWTHRGMTGKAEAGYCCGGRTYGYRHVPIEHESKKDAYGRPMILAVKLEVNPPEADTVREIFALRASGRGYAAIAQELNRRGIPSSRGRLWVASGVRVILENSVYSGELTWNRRAWARNPDTGRRLYRLRPREEWVVRHMPELRIVPEETIEAVRRLQVARGEHYRTGSRSSAQKHLFSGLLKCAECGGNFVVIGRDRYGCANRKTRGSLSCSNTVSVPRELLEGRLLRYVQEELSEPENYEKFKRIVQSLLSSKRSEEHTKATEDRLRQARKSRDNLLDAIKQGIITAGTKEALEREEEILAQLESELEIAQRNPIAEILPRAAERYQQLVANLSESLRGHVESARDILQSLIGGCIKLHRHRGGYLEAELPQGVAMMLQAANAGADLRGCGGQIQLDSVWIPLVPGRAGGVRTPQESSRSGSTAEAAAEGAS